MSKMSASTNDMLRYRYSTVLSQWWHESGDAGAIVITEDIVISGIVITRFYCIASLVLEIDKIVQRFKLTKKVPTYIHNPYSNSRLS